MKSNLTRPFNVSILLPKLLGTLFKKRYSGPRGDPVKNSSSSQSNELRYRLAGSLKDQKIIDSNRSDMFDSQSYKSSDVVELKSLWQCCMYGKGA